MHPWTVIEETIPTKVIKPRTKVPYLTDDLLHLKRSVVSTAMQKGWHSQGLGKYTKLRNQVTSAYALPKSLLP